MIKKMSEKERADRLEGMVDRLTEKNVELADKLFESLKRESPTVSINRLLKQLLVDSEIWYDAIRDIARGTVDSASAQQFAQNIYRANADNHCEIRTAIGFIEYWREAGQEFTR